MRLICPNCDAQYEVSADAIPAEGRDVQCSSCGHAWFQAPVLTSEMATAELYRAPEPIAQTNVAVQQSSSIEATVSAPLPRRKLDDDLMAVLREEAEREIAARQSERIEVQDDLGLPEPEPARKPAFQEEPVEELSVTERRVAAMQGKPLPRIKSAARRDMFPDIEEINSTLRPNSKKLPSEGEVPSRAEGSRGGFRSGFVLALLIAGGAVAVYVMAPQLQQQFPSLNGALDQYVLAVDGLRTNADQLFRNAAEYLKGMTAVKG